MTDRETVRASEDAPAAGCIMCDSLYVKPDGALPCWDDVGEDLILRTLDEKALIAGREQPIFSSPHLVEIRQAFLDGRMPHPDFCSRCPVYGHGVARQTHPKVINVLHVEPAYLCQLACPQCFTPKERLGLKKPPYYMTLEFYEALLDQLRREGVEHIRFVIFEGRGEPLLNPKLGDFVAATKARFPNTFTVATTHGNFPYKPWMHTCGLDILRMSVDGAFPESYRKYRVGGSLDKTLRLMADLKAHRSEHPDSVLQVEWKYILFEWNDSDAELRRAGELAAEHDARLSFCLTHTPGRSKRVPDEAALARVIAEHVPGAKTEKTFQLRDAPTDAPESYRPSEHAESQLLAALACYRRNEPARAEAFIREALHAEGNHAWTRPTLWGDEIIGVAAACRSPSTASALANIALYLHHWRAAELLFSRYIELAPGAGDAQKVEAKVLELAIHNRLGLHAGKLDEISPKRRRRVAALAAELDPGVPDAVRRWPRLLPRMRSRIATGARPQTLILLARLREADGDRRTALTWLEAALDRGADPDAKTLHQLANLRRGQKTPAPCPVGTAD
ncbi:MAG: radical SAM protein [Acidobacteriota bacterium]